MWGRLAFSLSLSLCFSVLLLRSLSLSLSRVMFGELAIYSTSRHNLIYLLCKTCQPVHLSRTIILNSKVFISLSLLVTIIVIHSLAIIHITLRSLLLAGIKFSDFSDFQFFANISTREIYYWCKNFAYVLIVRN